MKKPVLAYTRAGLTKHDRSVFFRHCYMNALRYYKGKTGSIRVVPGFARRLGDIGLVMIIDIIKIF